MSEEKVKITPMPRELLRAGERVMSQVKEQQTSGAMSEKRQPTASERRAEKIVDTLEREFFHGLCGDSCHFDWDHDKARRVIAPLIPQTAAEFEEEIDLLLEKSAGIENIPKPNPNSPINRLRRAVHATPEMSIRTVLEAAIEKLEKPSDE